MLSIPICLKYIVHFANKCSKYDKTVKITKVEKNKHKHTHGLHASKCSLGLPLCFVLIKYSSIIIVLFTQDKGVIEDSVLDKVQASYRQTACEMMTLLSNKLKYLESLQI